MNKRKSPVRRTLSGSTPGDSAGPRSRRRRTPPLGTNVVHAPETARAEAPAWVNRARILIVSLEEALAEGSPNPAVAARVEMAFAAWELAAKNPDSVARVAHLVERAYEAIRATPRPLDDQAVRGCAHILYTGLPMSVRANVNFPKIVSLVQALQKETEAWSAVVKTTAEILGWTGLAMTHAGQAIRVAMASHVNAAR